MRDAGMGIACARVSAHNHMRVSVLLTQIHSLQPPPAPPCRFRAALTPARGQHAFQRLAEGEEGDGAGATQAFASSSLPPGAQRPPGKAGQGMFPEKGAGLPGGWEHRVGGGPAWAVGGPGGGQGRWMGVWGVEMDIAGVGWGGGAEANMEGSAFGRRVEEGKHVIEDDIRGNGGAGLWGWKCI